MPDGMEDEDGLLPSEYALRGPKHIKTVAGRRNWVRGFHHAQKTVFQNAHSITQRQRLSLSARRKPVTLPKIGNPNEQP